MRVPERFPELVTTDAQGYKMVNYGELPYLTLAAVKELKAENDGLRAQLAALAERLEKIEREALRVDRKPSAPRHRCPR